MDSGSRGVFIIIIVVCSSLCIAKYINKQQQHNNNTSTPTDAQTDTTHAMLGLSLIDSMILPQVHLRKPCYDFSFL